MFRTRIIAITLASTVLAAAPAHAGGLLGGSGLGGLISGPTNAADCGPAGVNGVSAAGRATGSVNGALGVTANRTGSGRHSQINVGLAGSVNSVANAAAGANGLGRSVSLAGSSSTHAAVNKQAGVGLAGVSGNRGIGLAGKVNHATGAALAVTRGTGNAGSSRSVNATLDTATNAALAATKSHGNVGNDRSVKATLDSATNVALGVTKSHGNANMSVLNKTATTGHSAVNIAALNGRKPDGSSGGTGGGSGIGLPSVGLPNVGLPSLSGCSSSCSGGAGAKGGSSSGNGSGGSRSAQTSGGSGSQGGQATPTGQPRERDMADRKDLWWPQHTEGSYRDGRLHDH